MKHYPLVTVVTPSFNQGQFIEETILSVLKQDYENIQYIVIDGGSTDETMAVVEKYRDRIDIVIHEKDSGQTDAINKGFKLAKGELVGWINSDDILYPDCIEKIVRKYCESPNGSIYYNSNSRKIDSLGEVIVNYKKSIPHRDFLLKKSYDVIQQGSFYRRDLVEKVNFLDAGNYYSMDLDLWLKLLKYGPIYDLDCEPIGAFRIWEETKTSTGREKFLDNIRAVLFSQGANIYHKSVRRTYWYTIKTKIKQTLSVKK